MASCGLSTMTLNVRFSVASAPTIYMGTGREIIDIPKSIGPKSASALAINTTPTMMWPKEKRETTAAGGCEILPTGNELHRPHGNPMPKCTRILSAELNTIAKPTAVRDVNIERILDSKNR